jgi:hypothetical protein
MIFEGPSHVMNHGSRWPDLQCDPANLRGPAREILFDLRMPEIVPVTDVGGTELLQELLKFPLRGTAS